MTRQEHSAAKIGQKDDRHTSLTTIINDNAEQQVQNSNQNSRNTAESIMQVIREKGSGEQIHHKQKGGDKTIRRNKRRMTDNKALKKVARKGETW